MPRRSGRKFANMPRANRYWNGKISGLGGAGAQGVRAVLCYISDRFATWLARPNLCSVGSRVVIQHGVVIRYPHQIELCESVRLGRGVELDSELADGRLVIGAGTWIGRRCRLDFSGGLVIGEDCTVSEDVTILTHDHGLSPRSKPMGRPLKIGHRVWIGANATILSNVSEIGDDSIVAAGSIVTKMVPSGAIVGGNPGQVIGTTKDNLS